MWVVIVMDVTNQAHIVALPAETIDLVDDLGRHYPMSQDRQLLLTVARDYGVQHPYEVIMPGDTMEVVMVFPVSLGVSNLALVSAESDCAA